MKWATHLLVHRYRLGLIEIALHGLGGHCAYASTGTRWQQAVVAWGGIWAQLVVLVLALVALLVLGPPSTAFAADLYWVAIASNLWIVGFNLLPVPPLDGARAWPLVPMIRERLRGEAARRRRRQHEERLRERALRAADDVDAKPSEDARRVVQDLIERSRRSGPED
jgi:hypothetical protein